MLIEIKNFGGLIPKLSNRALPPNYATVADNTQLYSGEVRGLREPVKVADLTDRVFTVQRAYRLNDGSTSIFDAVGDWIAFDDSEVNFIRGALKNDQFDRYYAAGGSQLPVVASATDWAANNTAQIYDLGVPAPSTAPTVTPPAEASTNETRAYVYTFVNEWGEESAPSPASPPATGNIAGTWAITNLQTAYPVAGNHNPISKIRIYRTVTGSASVDYRFVTEISGSLVSTYDDDGSGAQDAYGYVTSTDAISLNESIPSIGWDLPPSNLQGIVNMANGIMVGFVGRDLYFSEPYRPHAWPPEYSLSVEAEIVGLGVYQSGAVICTTSNPYVATGSAPASIVLTKLDDVEPCQSFRSIVNGLDGVFYASQNGLVLVNQSGAQNVTQPLMSRNEWRDGFSPGTVSAATDGSRILAFSTISTGWLFSPLEELGQIVKLSSFTDVASVQTDPFTGEAYVVSRDVVYLWNPERTTGPLSYVWKSKTFETPRPVNMGAFRLQYEDTVGGEDYVPGFDYTTYNASRYDATTIVTPAGNSSPLNTLNLAPLNGVRVEANVDDSPPVVQYKYPIGGSPLVPTEPQLIRDRIRIQIWADGVLRYDREITSNEMQRLPSGYKADKWEVQFTTAQSIYSFRMAETASELRLA